MKIIDLNCDAGESFGAWKMGNDAELINYVSSVNIACGFHAGDARTMRETVEIALAKRVAIGAHPSFPDLQGFGRRAMSLSEKEIFDVVLYQISALKGICEAFGARLNHVKPHGALYNQAAKDRKIAAAIAEAVKKLDAKLIFYGLSGSFLISEAKKAGLETASEVFADRTYQDDGSLTPRSFHNALIENESDSLAQVLQMINQQSVTSVSGNVVSLETQTVCVHGDGSKAVEFAFSLRRALNESGVKIAAIKAR